MSGRKRRVRGVDGRQPPDRGDDFVGRVGPVERRAGVEDRAARDCSATCLCSSEARRAGAAIVVRADAMGNRVKCYTINRPKAKIHQKPRRPA